MSSEPTSHDPFDSIRYIPQYYNHADSRNSALRLILTLRPEWKECEDTIEFVRFTDGITNTVRAIGCPSFQDAVRWRAVANVAV